VGVGRGDPDGAAYGKTKKKKRKQTEEARSLRKRRRKKKRARGGFRIYKTNKKTRQQGIVNKEGNSNESKIKVLVTRPKKFSIRVEAAKCTNWGKNCLKKGMCC